MLRVQMLRPSAERQAEAAMVPVCCDALEEALKARVLVTSEQFPGIVYIRAASRLWAIQRCPHCGAELALPPTDAPLEAEVLEEPTPPPEPPPEKKTRRCALCRTPGHRSDTCPNVKGRGQ